MREQSSTTSNNFFSRLRWKIAQAAEIRWWKYYLKKKDETIYLSWKANYWKELLKRMNIRLTPNEQILDAGCGPAGMFMVLDQQKVDALDPLIDSYESRLKHFSKTSYPYCEFHALPLEAFQIKEEYDKVFCLNAINHVADLPLCMDQLTKATKKGGHLIFSIDAHNYAAFKSIFKLLPGDILHPHQYDLEEYQIMLTNRGFTIQQCELFKAEFLFNYYVIRAVKN